MSTLADLVKSRRQAGGGVFGSLSSSLKEKIKETIDPRRFINQTGILTALFPKLKSYKAKMIGASTPKLGAVEDISSNLILDEMQKSSEIAAKNSMVLPAIHRDINVMRQNVAKLVKLEGAKPATKADMWFKKQKNREIQYEQTVAKPTTKKAQKRPTKPKETKPSKTTTTAPTTPGKSIIGAITGGTKGLSVGKVAAGAAVGAAVGLTALTARGESKGGDYNIVVGGSKADLTSMSLGEILSFQDKMKESKKYPSTAVGKYQIIQPTLKGAIKTLGLGLNEKFDEKMQERIFKEYLIGAKRKGVSDYINAKVPDTPETLQKAQMEMAMEFASYGVPRDVRAGEFGTYPKANINKGDSFYSGVAGNKASISPEDSAVALKQDRMRNEGKTVVPHPGTTPTGVPVPQTAPKIDGNKIAETSADVKRAEEKPIKQTEIIIKENNKNIVSTETKSSVFESVDYSRVIEQRQWK